jgi:hypothetical protein
VIIDAQLHRDLRTLKLSGMLETLDARLAQARAGELGHIEFLQVLCHDEIARRESQAIARRLRRAQFEAQATLEGVDFAASPKLPAAQIRDLAALRWLAAGESVILYGPVGVGKTHIAQALGHLAIRHGADVRFAKTSGARRHPSRPPAVGTWNGRMPGTTNFNRLQRCYERRHAVVEAVLRPRRRDHHRPSPDPPGLDHPPLEHLPGAMSMSYPSIRATSKLDL